MNIMIVAGLIIHQKHTTACVFASAVSGQEDVSAVSAPE